MKVTIKVFMQGDFALILTKLDQIMTTQTEAAIELNAVAEQVTKIGSETSTLLVKIQELTQAIENAGQDITPEVQQALDAVKAQVQIVDDLVPDQP